MLDKHRSWIYARRTFNRRLFASPRQSLYSNLHIDQEAVTDIPYANASGHIALYFWYLLCIITSDTVRNVVFRNEYRME
ncbi:hypothetical protein Tcan_14940 [Toxocara canis]|uniref:Uncharacterized protein n=1 Tax=Toxocara canis TaxID=6265 RepID=A0A0B2V528_TOXCA|nr:hypothetical protein Tcan_14940 [Toxocara canis]